MSKKICLIIGDPIDHSLSPVMHNAGYRALGIDSEYIFLKKRVGANETKKAINEMREKNYRGLTCTMPHKIEVMKYLDEIDNSAKKIGAVNTVINNNGRLKGYNTDWIGVAKSLEKITVLKNKKVALIGAGGASRAAIFGLSQEGAIITIFNRTLEKAEKLAKEFNCQAESIEDIEKIKDYDIIINATSIGMEPNSNLTPVSQKYLLKNQIVFDFIYNPLETRLLREAREVGAKTISGLEMLLYQGAKQFEYYTGRIAPLEAMRNGLMSNLDKLCKI